MANPINIVVIGSNIAGNTITHYILKHIVPSASSGTRPINLTIISPSTKFYWTLGTPRALLNRPELLNPEAIFADIIPELSKLYGPQGHSWVFHEAWARDVDFTKKTVTIEPVTGDLKTDQIHYDHLILATGTRNVNHFQPSEGTSRDTQLYNLPPFKPHGTTKESLEALKSWGDRIANANTILLIGAGPTGVETAGEIKSQYPEKNVILASSGDILPMLQPRISDIAKQQLRKLGVQLQLNTKVNAVNPTAKGVEVVLSNQEKLSVDLYIPTIGQAPNTDFLPKDILDHRGFVVTTNYMNLSSQPNVWSLGDVTHWDDNRKATTIDAQAQVLTSNLQKVLQHGGVVGKSDGWKEYKHTTEQMMFVPMGKKYGVGQVKGRRVWTFIVRMMKGKDFMVSWIPKYTTGSQIAKKL